MKKVIAYIIMAISFLCALGLSYVLSLTIGMKLKAIICTTSLGKYVYCSATTFTHFVKEDMIYYVLPVAILFAILLFIIFLNIGKKIHKNF